MHMGQAPRTAPPPKGLPHPCCRFTSSALRGAACGRARPRQPLLRSTAGWQSLVSSSASGPSSATQSVAASGSASSGNESAAEVTSQRCTATTGGPEVGQVPLTSNAWKCKANPPHMASCKHVKWNLKGLNAYVAASTRSPFELKGISKLPDMAQTSRPIVLRVASRLETSTLMPSQRPPRR